LPDKLTPIGIRYTSCTGSWLGCDRACRVEPDLAVEGDVAEPPIRPLAPAPVLRDQVYDTPQTLTTDGTLRPGERLLEAELAEQLSVSRNPVREALTLLARSGWVDLRPRHGAHVHQPTAKEVEDFFRIRQVLEVESVRLAAENATPDDATVL